MAIAGLTPPDPQDASATRRRGPRRDGQRLGMVRMVAWAVAAMGLCWAGLALATGYPYVAATAALSVIGSLLTILLIDIGFTLLGRVLWFVFCIATVLIGSFQIHPDGKIDVLFLVMAGAPFLVFSRRKEGRVLYAMIGLNALAWVTHVALGHDFFGPTLVDAETADRYFALPAAVTAMIVLVLEIAFFDWTSQTYGERLHAASTEALNATRAKAELLAAMSHEIRTPMNGVVGMIELLETSPLSPEQKRMLATVRESSFALLRIIDDILDVSKAEAGKLKITPEPVELLPLLEGISDTLVPLARKRRVWFLQTFDPEMPSIATLDGDRVRQILVNLLGNAIKFSERPAGVSSQALVTLHVSCRDEMIHLSVNDNGVGMDEETMAHAFERYMQSNAVSARRFGGTGLGLAIVHQLVKHMAGSIAVNSVLGEGTAIEVRLPLVAPKGRIAHPDLGGWTVVSYFSTAFKREITDSYLRPTGARLLHAEDEEQLHQIATAQGPDTLYLIAPETRPLIVDETVLHRFEAAFPQARCVTFSAKPSDRFGLLTPTRLRLQWSPMKLTEFYEALALIARQEVAQPKVSSAETAVAANAVIEDAPSILVVEDNEINREVLSKQLMALGYGVTIARDGEEGLALWRETDFALVLTDCHMPRMDGFDMTRRLREIEESEDRPRSAVVAITANALNDERANCMAAGMDTVLTKPVRLALLRETVAEWMAEALRERVRARPDDDLPLRFSQR